MNEHEKLVYNTAINDARSVLINIANKLLDEGNSQQALSVAEGSQSISKLIMKYDNG